MSHVGIRNLILVLVALVLLAACAPEATVVSIADLTKNQQMYVDQTVTVEGKVTEYLGEKDSVLLLPYVMGGKVLLNASQTRTGNFKFSDESGRSVIVAEKTGGLYLPIVYSPAGKPTLPQGKIKITGEWRKENDGSYVLYVSGTEPVPTQTP